MGKVWTANLSIVCNGIFLARQWGKLILITLGSERVRTFNTFTPKSDQFQISPVASPVIVHHTVWRTWISIAYSDWKMILVPVLTTSLIMYFLSLGLKGLTLSLPCWKSIFSASPGILHHMVWRKWLFIAYSDGRWLTNPHYLNQKYAFLCIFWGECTFWTWEWMY